MLYLSVTTDLFQAMQIFSCMPLPSHPRYWSRRDQLLALVAPECGSRGENMRRFRSWYCLMTHHKQERVALEHLERQGFSTFLPLHCPSPDKPGRDGKPVIYPMWSGYLFVSWFTGDRWGPILSTHGVKGFLGISHERPRPLPLGMVEQLQQVADASSIIDPGTQVTVLTGNSMWKGHTGICQASDNERVSLLFDIFNKRVVVSFNRADLRKAGDHG